MFIFLPDINWNNLFYCFASGCVPILTEKWINALSNSVLDLEDGTNFVFYTGNMEELQEKLQLLLRTVDDITVRHISFINKKLYNNTLSQSAILSKIKSKVNE